MSLFEALSGGFLKKLTLLTVEKDFFDLVLKPLEVSDSFRVKFTQLEKPFKYLTRFSSSLLEPHIFKCNLILLKLFLASIAL